MRSLSALLVLSLGACAGSSGSITPPHQKPDPYVTIRVRDMLDTTLAPGRAHWHMYVLLTGPYDRLNGISYQGNIGLNDLRLGHDIRCVASAADSVGQRLLSVVAFADTTTEALTPDAQFEAFVQEWYAGNRTLPQGWMVLTFPATDAWQSAQYLAGHGLVPSDPIKWGFDWSGSGTASFYERSDSESQCSTMI